MIPYKNYIIFFILLCNIQPLCADVLNNIGSFFVQHPKSMGVLIGIVSTKGSSESMSSFRLMTTWLLMRVHSSLKTVELPYYLHYFFAIGTFFIAANELTLYLKSRVPVLYHAFNR
jgi:hypothetical protein